MKKRKIRVLHVTETTIAGVRRYLFSLLKNLDRQRFELAVASPRSRYGKVEEKGFAKELHHVGIPLHPVDMRREINLSSDLKAILHLSQIIRRGKFDIIHTHSSKGGILGRFAAKLNGVKTVHTPNGFYFLGLKGHKRRSFLLFEQLAGVFSDKLIAVSTSEREAAISHRVISSRKLVTIPNAIDASGFTEGVTRREQMRAELGLAKDSPVIGTVARYSLQKDPLNFVRAAHTVLLQRPDVCFLWCGEGEMRAKTEALAERLGIHHAFRFLGFRPDVKDVMNTFDLFVLSSIFEGLPYSLLEAMSLKLPIAATDVVGIRDVVVHDKTGLLVPPKEPEQLATAILQLINQPQKLAGFGQEGYQLVCSKYSIPRMVDGVQRIYDSLVS